MKKSTIAATLNASVQEFIVQHSSALFNDQFTENKSKIKRALSSSDRNSSLQVQQEEDPDLFVITPPLEYFLKLSTRICREQLFKFIHIGHLLIGCILAVNCRELLIRLLCFDDGNRRYIEHLKLPATCLLSSSIRGGGVGGTGQNFSKKQSIDDEKMRQNNDKNDDGEYKCRDLIRVCVTLVDYQKEEIHVTIDQHHPSMKTIEVLDESGHLLSSTKKLGIVNEDDLPLHYSLLRRQKDDQIQSYEDILHSSRAFNNRACVTTLYQKLKQNSVGNNILNMTLIEPLRNKQIPTEEHYDKLRQKQDRDWALESVAAGVRLMKENQFNSALLHLNKALSTDSTCVDGYVARGALLANQGHFKRAMSDFQSALDLDSSHQNAINYMHDVLCSLANEADNYDDSIDYLQKALACKPNSIETRNKIDELHTKKKEAQHRLEYGPTLPAKSPSSRSYSKQSSTTTEKTNGREKSSSSGKTKRRRRQSSSSSTTSSSSSSSGNSSSSTTSSSSTSSSSSSSISSKSKQKSTINDKKSQTSEKKMISVKKPDISHVNSSKNGHLDGKSKLLMSLTNQKSIDLSLNEQQQKLSPESQKRSTTQAETNTHQSELSLRSRWDDDSPSKKRPKTRWNDSNNGRKTLQLPPQVKQQEQRKTLPQPIERKKDVTLSKLPKQKLVTKTAEDDDDDDVELLYLQLKAKKQQKPNVL